VLGWLPDPARFGKAEEMAEVKTTVIAQERPSGPGRSIVRSIDVVTLQLRRVIRAAAYVSGFLVLAMTVFMTFDVLMRYGLGRATAVADDLTAYMLVGITFLGAGSTEIAKLHINVESFSSLLGQRPQKVFRLVTLLLSLAYVVFLTWQVFAYVATSWRLQYLSAGLVRFPLWMPQALIPAGLCMLALALLVNIVEAVLDLLGHRPCELES
jgi:C4-dicarboxylate transporter DctQ subunit